ncbi:MAG: hypothetical protein AB8E15_12145 [Bdellovibrionales bacterium]
MLFELKQLLINYKLQLSALGLILPFFFVSVVYQMRMMLNPTLYKMMMMSAFGSVALIPLAIVALSFTPVLKTGDCVQHRTRNVSVKVKDKEFTMALTFMVKSMDKDRYVLTGNDNSFLKMNYNKIDKSTYYRKVACPIALVRGVASK